MASVTSGLYEEMKASALKLPSLEACVTHLGKRVKKKRASSEVSKVAFHVLFDYYQHHELNLYQLQQVIQASVNIAPMGGGWREVNLLKFLHGEVQRRIPDEGAPNPADDPLLLAFQTAHDTYRFGGYISLYLQDFYKQCATLQERGELYSPVSDSDLLPFEQTCLYITRRPFDDPERNWKAARSLAYGTRLNTALESRNLLIRRDFALDYLYAVAEKKIDPTYSDRAIAELRRSLESERLSLDQRLDLLSRLIETVEDEAERLSFVRAFLNRFSEERTLDLGALSQFLHLVEGPHRLLTALKQEEPAGGVVDSLTSLLAEAIATPDMIVDPGVDNEEKERKVIRLVARHFPIQGLFEDLVAVARRASSDRAEEWVRLAWVEGLEDPVEVGAIIAPLLASLPETESRGSWLAPTVMNLMAHGRELAPPKQLLALLHILNVVQPFAEKEVDVRDLERALKTPMKEGELVELDFATIESTAAVLIAFFGESGRTMASRLSVRVILAYAEALAEGADQLAPFDGGNLKNLFLDFLIKSSLEHETKELGFAAARAVAASQSPALEAEIVQIWEKSDHKEWIFA